MFRCVHCLNYYNRKSKTKDHVFPKGWYPLNTPATVEKLTVPACLECNQRLKILEEGIFLRWASATDEKDPAAQGINEKVREIINVSGAKDNKVTEIRQRALQRLIKDYVEFDPEKTFKHTGPKEGVRGTLALRTTNKATIELAKKIIRGLEYRLRGNYIENGRNFQIHYPMVKNNEEMDRYFKRWEELVESNKFYYKAGEGFTVEYGINPEVPAQIIYKVRIWNLYEFWGLVI